MVGLDDKTKNLSSVPPEERIKLLKRLKELDEEKLRVLEKQKEKELEELKNKSKALDDELSEDIKDSIEELTEIESKKRFDKHNSVEEKILQQQKAIKGINYDSLVNKINSENTIDKSNAYELMKQVTQNQEEYPEKERLDYSSLQKIKTVVDKMNEEEDNFGYKKRMTTIINQAFDNIKKYDGDH